MDPEAHSTHLPSVYAADANSKSSGNAADGDHVPKQVHEFYFVKQHANENPYLIKAENLIQKLNQKRLQIHQTRDEKLSLHFGLLHGNKSLREEGQILRKIKEAEEIPEDTSVRDFDDKIRELSRRIQWRLNIKADEKEQILREIEKIERARAEAIESATASAALNGKMWHSLGSKEDIVQQIKTIGDELDKERAEYLNSKRKAEKKREAVEADLGRLEKRLTHTVEKFMWQWSNNKAFRDEYRRRTAESLNNRSLTVDGLRKDQTRNRFS
ncbi:hypothetical protein CDL15_Pgr023381 [Punica granatum]|uniref:Proton pump-interactor 1-like n=1 Tax=Punica granatum TaxID=22663 RepID=A0A218Y1V6_PUNGR|nr:hypothetical protein CDL15_Pgr023381 [Punica granatum]